MRFGNLLFDPKFRYASGTDGRTVHFTPVESAALALLTGHVGQILPRQRLLDVTQRGDSDALERSVDLLINRLRAKLGDSARAPVSSPPATAKATAGSPRPSRGRAATSMSPSGRRPAPRPCAPSRGCEPS